MKAAWTGKPLYDSCHSHEEWIRRVEQLHAPSCFWVSLVSLHPVHSYLFRRTAPYSEEQMVLEAKDSSCCPPVPHHHTRKKEESRPGWLSRQAGVLGDSYIRPSTPTHRSPPWSIPTLQVGSTHSHLFRLLGSMTALVLIFQCSKARRLLEILLLPGLSKLCAGSAACPPGHIQTS